MIALQRCAECRAWQYPRRDACVQCLSDSLGEEAHSGDGVARARAVLRTGPGSPRIPVTVLTVTLDDGPHLIAFGDAAPGRRVIVRHEGGRYHAGVQA
jgi:uncharacterized OB-fold protein